MIGSLAFKLKELQEAEADRIAYHKGSAGKLSSPMDKRDDLECSDLLSDLDELKAGKKEDRPELHFRAAAYRDMRHSVAGSQFILRQALWNRQRDNYETARALSALELYNEQ